LYSTAGWPPARPRRRLVGGPSLATCLGSHENDPPISENSHEFEFAAQRDDVPTQRGDEAVFEITPSLEARHIRLVHGRIACNVDLRLPNGLSDGTNRQMNASLST